MTSSSELKAKVSQVYAEKLNSASTCCDTEGDSACSPVASAEGVPEGAVSFGCGNPVALASLRPGETVVDLGSGAGLDCIHAAQQVGPNGVVIGVDFTTEMLERARQNVAQIGLGNVEFRMGDIEALPVEDESVDVVISNCVINLAPDKDAVFLEAFRVLRPGGRLMVSDILLTRPATEAEKNDMALLTGCISGSLPVEEYLGKIRAAGFPEVTYTEEKPVQFGQFWFSAAVSATK